MARHISSRNYMGPIPRICFAHVAALLALCWSVETFGESAKPGLYELQKGCTTIERRKQLWRDSCSILREGSTNSFAERAAACLVLRNWDQASRWAGLVTPEDAKEQLVALADVIKGDSEKKIGEWVGLFQRVDLSTEGKIAADITKVFSGRTGVAIGFEDAPESVLSFYVPVRLLAQDHNEAAAVWNDLAMCLDAFEGVIPIRIVLSSSEPDKLDPLVYVRKQNGSRVMFPRYNFRRARGRDILESLWFGVWSQVP